MQVVPMAPPTMPLWYDNALCPLRAVEHESETPGMRQLMLRAEAEKDVMAQLLDRIAGQDPRLLRASTGEYCIAQVQLTQLVQTLHLSPATL